MFLLPFKWAISFFSTIKFLLLDRTSIKLANTLGAGFFRDVSGSSERPFWIYDSMIFDLCLNNRCSNLFQYGNNLVYYENKKESNFGFSFFSGIMHRLSEHIKLMIELSYNGYYSLRLNETEGELIILME